MFTSGSHTATQISQYSFKRKLGLLPFVVTHICSYFIFVYIWFGIFCLSYMKTHTHTHETHSLQTRGVLHLLPVKAVSHRSCTMLDIVARWDTSICVCPSSSSQLLLPPLYSLFISSCRASQRKELATSSHSNLLRWRVTNQLQAQRGTGLGGGGVISSVGLIFNKQTRPKKVFINSFCLHFIIIICPQNWGEKKPTISLLHSSDSSFIYIQPFFIFSLGGQKNCWDNQNSQQIRSIK